MTKRTPGRNFVNMYRCFTASVQKPFWSICTGDLEEEELQLCVRVLLCMDPHRITSQQRRKSISLIIPPSHSFSSGVKCSTYLGRTAVRLNWYSRNTFADLASSIAKGYIP